MLRRKLAESLTVRIFLLTFLLLLGAGGLTFALIAWATPITYTAVISDRLQAQVADLTQQLAQTNLADAGPILDAFVRESGAEVALTAPGGAEADTGSLLVLPEEDWQVAVTMSGADNSVQTYEADTYQVQIDRADGVVTATQTGILTTQITFADQEGTYQLLVSPQLRLANQAVEALGRVAPWLALALLAFSLLCAFGYSRYITRPIVRLNGIAGRMAELDLQWVCGERRRDEIGQLGRSLDKMARRLSAALTDLETANQALRGEVARERELDRQRMAFFSAASHELKTPVTILKGQLAGMLEGVGVYQDRDKYLLRSLQTTGRMERLIGEMLVHLPHGVRICRRPAGARGPVRPDGAATGSGPGAAGAAGPAAGVRTDPGDYRARRRLPAGEGRGQPALQRLPLLAGGGGNPGLVRPVGGPPRPECGEHRSADQRRCPAPPV